MERKKIDFLLSVKNLNDIKGKYFATERFSICEPRKATKASENLVSFNSVFFISGYFLLKYKAGGASLFCSKC